MISTPDKYAKSCVHKDAFRFPRNEIRDLDCLKGAFEMNGHKFVDVSYELHGMMVWVMTEDGRLWLNDFTHGGGGVFVPQTTGDQ